VNVIEDLISTALLGAFGNPIVLGIFAIIFFIAIGAIFGLGLEGMMIFGIPAILLVTAALPVMLPLKIILLFAIGIILGVFFLAIVRH